MSRAGWMPGPGFQAPPEAEAAVNCQHSANWLEDASWVQWGGVSVTFSTMRTGVSRELGSVCAVGSPQVCSTETGLGAGGGGQASSRWLLHCPVILPRGLFDSHFPRGLDVLEMLTFN